MQIHRDQLRQITKLIKNNLKEGNSRDLNKFKLEGNKNHQVKDRELIEAIICQSKFNLINNRKKI